MFRVLVHRICNLELCRRACLGRIRCVGNCLVCIRQVMPIFLVGFDVGMVVMVVVMVVVFEVSLMLGMVQCGTIVMIGMLDTFFVIVCAERFVLDRMKFGARWILECAVLWVEVWVLVLVAAVVVLIAVGNCVVRILV